MTFFEVFGKWLDAHKYKVKQTTFYTYRSYSMTFSRFIDSDTDICALDESRMKSIIENVRDTGMKDHTIKDLLIVFRMVMRYADKELSISGLPSIDWEIKNMSADRFRHSTGHHIKRFTVEEYERIIKVIENDPTPAGVAIMTTMFTGMRIGEVCGLKFSDIDFDEGVIHVQRTCVNVTKEIQNILRPDEEYISSQLLQSPKSATSDRFIPLVPKLRKMLQNYAKIYPGEYFVSTMTDRPAVSQTLRTHYKKTLKKAHVSFLNYHCLRHTFATQMVEKNVDVKTVSSILGHAGVEITMDTYCHPSDDVKRAGIQKAFKGILKW